MTNYTSFGKKCQFLPGEVSPRIPVKFDRTATVRKRPCGSVVTPHTRPTWLYWDVPSGSTLLHVHAVMLAPAGRDGLLWGPWCSKSVIRLDPSRVERIEGHEGATRSMPEIFRQDGFVFFFYMNENREPVHVHVRHAGGFAKFWMEPIELDFSAGMKTQEVARAEKLIVENEQLIRRKWNEVFPA